MLEKIYERIKEYNTIVIARHIGVDPDALGAQFGLKLSIMNTFPDKKVYAVGQKSFRYNYFPKMDRFEHTDDNALLIVLDTPDIKRVDIEDFSSYREVIKIDHHPVVDKFGELEYVDTVSSSASELILRFLETNNMYIDDEIARYIFMGIVSDTNRFMFNTNPRVLRVTADLIEKYNIDVENTYHDLFRRPLSEVRLHGYISENMKVTPNGLGYIYITNDIMAKYGADANSAGNMVNSFNDIAEVIVWTTISEDVKNGLIKFNIRSRGPSINVIAENYNGGGHKLAAGAKVHDENEARMLIEALDNACKEYLEKERENETR